MRPAGRPGRPQDTGWRPPQPAASWSQGNGTVLPGGDDWSSTRGDVCELHARYLIRTDDGVVVDVVNRGFHHPDATSPDQFDEPLQATEAGHYYRTSPVFRTAAAAHRRLAVTVFVGLARPDGDGVVVIRTYAVRSRRAEGRALSGAMTATCGDARYGRIAGDGTDGERRAFMGRMMQAYRIPEWQHPAEVVEVPVPTPGAGQVVVKVAGCGLCHSDFTMLDMPAEAGRAWGWSMPFTLGHETAGRIAELGPGVTGFAAGDPVALVSPSSCGTCSFCVRGLDGNCPHAPAGRGFGRDGGLAEYVLVDDLRALLPLHGLDPRTAGPLTDAGATSYHAVRRAVPRIRPGGTAVVIGAGGLGSFAVQYLNLLTGARVVAVDTDEARLKVARDLGADATLVGTTDRTAAEIRALTDGYGADAVLDFVGVDATIAAGTAAVRPAGTYGLIGAAMGRLQAPWYGGLPRDGEVFTFQGSSIADVREVLTLAETGRIRNNVDEFAFADIDKAYQALHDGTLHGRAVVTFAE